jgi:hypothetical protein
MGHPDRLSRFDGELLPAREGAAEPSHSPLDHPALRQVALAARAEAWQHSPETVAARGGDTSAPLAIGLADHVRAATGVDVSGATVHEGPAAARRAGEHAARAVTIGTDIYLGTGARSTDQHLLAHEATHVAQQAHDPAIAGEAQRKGPPGEVSSEPLEQQADAVADRAGAAPQRAPDGPGYALSETQTFIHQTRGFIDTTSATLVPAFRRAVDALDPPAALQLAQAAIQGLDAAGTGLERAEARGREADPYARTVSTPGQTAEAIPVEAWEVDEYDALKAEIEQLADEVRRLGHQMVIDMSPQVFRERAVLGSYQLPPGSDAEPLHTVIRESSTTVDLLITFVHVRQLLGSDPEAASKEAKKEAVSKVEMWRSRPANFRFLYHLLLSEKLLDALWTVEGESGQQLRHTQGDVLDQARATGNFADVGAWDSSEADKLLSRGLGDWAVTDEDAQRVFDMIASASPAARGKLVLQLDDMGKLGRLCDNLPWRWVEQLHDVVDDPQAKARLRPHFQNKGGGKSVSKLYEENIMENIEKDRMVRAYLWTFLDTAHSGLTFGFKDVHDAAYDASEEGWISDDAYLSTTGKALARSAALMGATMATGGAAGAWGEGVALGMGAGRTSAQIIGGAVGGATSGVAGQLTADVFDQAFLGKEGFSSLGDYGTAAGLGGATGALTAGVQAAGSRYLPQSAKTMSHVYAERYPQLDNVLTRVRNAGVRDGLVLRVTAQELNMLVRSGLTNPGNLQQSLDRIGMVYANERIDVNSRTLSKVHPQSEIEQMFGDVDAATGQVNIRNQEPSSAGYVADADSIPAGAKTTDPSMRDVLGIDGPAGFYDKYKNPGDPLFEVRFRVTAELDVPLPQTEAPGTPLGTMNPDSHHMAGAGVTKGGVPEGKLPAGAPIEIVDIVPVGTPRSSYPPVGTKPYGPYSPAASSVRNLGAPTAGATSGVTSGGYCSED